MKKNYLSVFIKQLNEEVAKEEETDQTNQETQDENLEWVFDEIFVSEEFREAVKKIYNLINEKVSNIGKEIDSELSKQPEEGDEGTEENADETDENTEEGDEGAEENAEEGEENEEE